MKKTAALILLAMIMMFMLTACDTPVDMFNLFMKYREQTGNMSDALGPYFADYGWDYYMWEGTVRDVSWEKAMEYSTYLKRIPKLVDHIGTFEPGEKFMIMYIKEPNYAEEFYRIAGLLVEAGYKYTSKDIDEKKDTYYVKYRLNTADDQKHYRTVSISAYKPEYSETHNLKLVFEFLYDTED